MKIKEKNSCYIKKALVLFVFILSINAEAQEHIAKPSSDTNYIYCTNTSYTFSSSDIITLGIWSAQPATYSGNVLVSGNIAVITFTATGTYTLNLLYSTQMNGGNKHSVQTIVHLDSCSNVGISKVNAENIGLKIYPNPTQDFLTIDIGNKENQELILFDISGKEIIQQTLKGTTTIDVSSLENGIYFLRFKSNLGICTEKVIVQH